MGLFSFLKIVPFVVVTDVSLTTDIPAYQPPPPVVAASDTLHKERKEFLVRTFRRIFQIENPGVELGIGTSKQPADHLLPYGVQFNHDDPCATDVTDRQVEQFGRVAGYDSFHWAWFPENKGLTTTAYRMYVITKMHVGDLGAYLRDHDFISRVAADTAGYDGYLADRDIDLDRIECAGFDLYHIELS